MSTEELKKLFQEAAEIAKAVPKELREAAFNRALDALSLPAAKMAPPTRPRALGNPREGSSEGDHAAILLRDLDRTRHPEVASAPRVLERALFILRAARDDHSIDGLSAPQIAKVLNEKFRLRTTRQAVTQALDAAGDKVDRNSSRRIAVYRIMHQGDQYLAAGAFDSGTSRAGGSSAGIGVKRRTKLEAAAKKEATTTTPVRGHKKKGGISRRPGPGAMLRDLVAAGFFAKPKTIGEIQAHAQQNKAHNYGLNELSTPLRRAIHDDLLVRAKNSDGQYEYATP
ncbi:MAG: hypothetical protein ABI609_15895 [Acidobacteriota bacterium]